MFSKLTLISQAYLRVLIRDFGSLIEMSEQLTSRLKEIIRYELWNLKCVLPDKGNKHSTIPVSHFTHFYRKNLTWGTLCWDNQYVSCIIKPVITTNRAYNALSSIIHRNGKSMVEILKKNIVKRVICTINNITNHLYIGSKNRKKVVSTLSFKFIDLNDIIYILCNSSMRNTI